MQFGHPFSGKHFSSINSLKVRVDMISVSEEFQEATKNWLEKAIKQDYAHKFSWLGRPIIQIPQDIYALQELIWETKPDLIIETGVAHGGSLIMSASMLALLDYCTASENSVPLDPMRSGRMVVGIDIDIRVHNRKAIEAHPLSHLITLIEGSSTDVNVFEQIVELSAGFERVMVCLDSNHTHDHVLSELNIYAPLVTPDCYCVVWDTGIEDLPEGSCADRPWDKGNNPKTAVFEYLESLERGGLSVYEIDKEIEAKIAVTASPDGFLRRTR